MWQHIFLKDYSSAYLNYHLSKFIPQFLLGHWQKTTFSIVDVFLFSQRKECNTKKNIYRENAMNESLCQNWFVKFCVSNIV